MEDYYQILGVSANAGQEEVKKAFRRLSLKHHPDKGGNSGQFQRVNEAYQTIGNERKRKEYDIRRAGPVWSGGGAIPPEEELLRALFAGGIPGMFGPGTAGRVHVFRNGVPMRMSALRKPVPITKTVTITLTQAYTGINYPLEVERWVHEQGTKRMEKEKIYINIMAGIDDGEMIVLRGKGNVLDDQNRGDIKLFVRVKNDTCFAREGLDLVYERQLSLKEALSGFCFDVKHVSGKTYTINNTNGRVISPGYRKCIPELGMRRVKPHPAPPMLGNLVIRFTIKFPSTLTDAQREMLKKIL